MKDKLICSICGKKKPKENFLKESGEYGCWCNTCKTLPRSMRNALINKNNKKNNYKEFWKN